MKIHKKPFYEKEIKNSIINDDIANTNGPATASPPSPATASPSSAKSPTNPTAKSTAGTGATTNRTNASDLAGHNIIVSMGFDAQSQMPDSRYYGYDAVGRQTSAIDDSDPKQNQRHDYDQLDRLTGSQRGEPQLSRTDYSYDLSGNRSEKIKDNATLYSYSTDPNSNRLQGQSGAQTASYSYDPAGNLTSDGSFSYSYNAAGRRTTTTDTTTGQATNYGYDALGQRISKTNAGNTSQYFYDEQGHLTGEYDATGQLIKEIIWLGDLPVAVLKPTTTPANPTATADIYYIHADHLGTPRKITRPNDNRVVWRWESEAFGNSLHPPGLGNFVFNLRFPGQYYDQETGLHYNMARYYNPRTGGFDQSDPIGLAGGINTYAYVDNNPVNLIDPDGLAPDSEPLCATDGSQGSSCTSGMRPPPQGTPMNGPLSPVGIAATASDAALALIPGAKAASTLPKCPNALKTILQTPRNLSPTQSKSQISGSQIKRIAKDMKQNGYNGDPVDVSVNPNTGRLEIQDGHHRTAAVIKAGVAQIPVRVTE